MRDGVKDNRLLRILRQKMIARNNWRQFKSIRYCGSRVIKNAAVRDGVFLITDGDDSKFFGSTHCKSPWGCPVCTPTMMARYSTDIACALDALKKWYNQSAFMLTLTVPHTSGMTCQETTEIIYNTWKDFITHGNKNVKANDKEGKDKRWECHDVFASFCETLNCKHRVRVGEYTYGSKGWHPHFHCLFWVDDDKFSHVIEWQDKFNERWLALAKKHTLKIWNKLYPNKKEDNKIRLEIMYSKMDTEGSKGAYISVDKNGNVIKQKSSNYICGWGGNREVTGNYQEKATHPDHMTPRQILEQAAETNDEQLYDLYFEYLLATRIKKHARINFSVRSGIRAIIQKWKETETYIETLKKNATNIRPWHVVVWFTEKQWLQICLLDELYECKPTLLKMARAPNAREEITAYLLDAGIDISGNGIHEMQTFLENNILNSLGVA